jgi:CPA1 family monovalent cation:H+ antiporter
MSAFNFTAILLTLAAIFGLLNQRTLKLPTTIGVMTFALLLSIAVLLLDPYIDSIDLAAKARAVLHEANLSDLLLDKALALLLFAGALHVDIAVLRQQRSLVLALATVGTFVSTGLIAIGAWAIFRLLGLDIPLIWCAVLGAVLAPTDPVAVAALLRTMGLPEQLQVVIVGESLFNDGVAVVLFLFALQMATGTAHELDAMHAIGEFAREVGGGALLGLDAGYLSYLAMSLVDDAVLELTVSLACAVGTYALAHAAGVSGPIAVVIAGLLIGNHATEHAMSANSRSQVLTFWTLIDEVLNTLLFLLIGLEILAISRDSVVLVAMLAAIVLVLLVRLVSVTLPMLVLRADLLPGAQVSTASIVAVLTWGGLRGGISVAMALSLPEGPYRDAILTVCYGVVVFSILVQGLSMPVLIRRLMGDVLELDASAHKPAVRA